MLSPLILDERNDIPRAVVVHAGSRDRYQVALALHEAGLLEKLVTDIYFPLDKPWFAHTFGRLLPMDLLSKRYCPGLPSESVCSTAGALVVIIVNRMLNRWNLYPVSDAILGTKARLLAQQASATIFSYSTYASEAFKRLTPGGEGEKQFRFLFQMHPHPASARRILQEELILMPDAGNSLRHEHEMSIPTNIYERLVTEPMMADYIVAASTFCAHTLIEQGIPPERVHVVPYGVDSAHFPEKSRASAPEGPLKLIFLGSIVQRKGIAYLFQAMEFLKGKPVQLVCCGRVAPDAALFRRYRDCEIEVKIGLPHNEVLRELHAADLFVFPSLLEGFAHVILEAMACGLPVITTPHTCGPDIIIEGEHGFIVPIRDVHALAEQIVWCLEHRDRLIEMGHQAAIRAREFTWERFRQSIREIYATIVSSKLS